MKRRVVITGIGTINPLGNTLSDTWSNIKAGKNGIAPISLFDTTDFNVKIAGEIKDFNIEAFFGKKQAKRMDRFTQFALKASDEAMRHGDVDVETIDLQRAGVFFSSGIGGLKTIAEQEDRAKAKGYDRISPFFIPMAIINIASGNIAIRYGFKGMATASVTACASATNTIGDAFRSIQHGYHDLVIAGGAEASITKLGLGGFSVMHALSKSEDSASASKPFDQDRDGFVMGEGAGAFILESLEHAQARKAKIHGEIVGYGATCDAHHITSPDPEGKGAYQCMKQALEDAGIQPDDIGYINAHGTSTPLNDKIEAKAIKDLFLAHTNQLKVSSTKSMIGHLLGASGAVEGIVSVLALKEGFIPPTINVKNQDKACDIDIQANKGENKAITYALSNSLGFGGHNATLVFKKWEA